MNESMKQWIDNASYHSLLSRWRNSPIGSPWFQGEIGEYYTKKMQEKQATLSHDERVSASKSVGWD